MNKIFRGFAVLVLAFLVIMVAALLSQPAQAGDYPPGCPWPYREGWTCMVAYNQDGEAVGWTYAQDTPGPTPETYPGPAEETGVIGEPVSYPGIEAQPAMDKIDPTPTAARMLVVTHHGRGRP